MKPRQYLQYQKEELELQKSEGRQYLILYVAEWDGNCIEDAN